MKTGLYVVPAVLTVVTVRNAGAAVGSGDDMSGTGDGDGAGMA